MATAPIEPMPAPPAAPAPEKSKLAYPAHHSRTLDEARKAAHERAEKLDKMTEAEWTQTQQKRHAWREKWKQMTPEEKEAYKKSHHRKTHKSTGDATTPAPAYSGQ
jgi:hypothetical protein